MKDSPVGVAAEKVLIALGLTAESSREANQIFREIGIVVSAKRIGKSSEPVGDGESYDVEYRNIDLTPIKQWIV